VRTAHRLLNLFNFYRFIRFSSKLDLVNHQVMKNFLRFLDLIIEFGKSLLRTELLLMKACLLIFVRTRVKFHNSFQSLIICKI